MTPRPQGGTPDGDAALAIQKLARDTGADAQELQTLYVLEGLLARIATSEHRDDFVLKGGVLLAAFAARRPTKDIDLQATGLANDAETVAARIREIATLDMPDGVSFDPHSVTATVIRDGSLEEYAGVRVRLVGRIGRSRLTVGVDVNFGDPIWPAPQLIELPRIVPLTREPVTMLGYPLEMVFAEKIVTAVDRGEGNTRWRDFADVYTLARLHSVDREALRRSLQTVAEHRTVALSPLLPTLSSMPQRAQAKWSAWRRRVGREEEVPAMFSDVLAAVAAFADPALGESAPGTWEPRSQRWL